MKALPNTSNWQPKTIASETLKEIFYKRCLNVESIIKDRSKQEQEFNTNNFDSGLGVEDIIREELSQVLPKRYLVTKGIVNDRKGFTAGDQDIIIFNDTWFPYLKLGATQTSRSFHFPIEGVYAIGEIKQTLTINELDKAIEKLVIGKRLERPKTGRTRIVENRELDDCKHGFTNPLYSFIIAVNLSEEITTDDIFMRFFELNKTLKRSELVNSLCILQKATISWAMFNKEKNELIPALFKTSETESNSPIFPVLLEIDDKRKSSFFDLTMLILAHLYDSILGGEDLALAYGNNYSGVKIPPLAKFQINPE